MCFVASISGDCTNVQSAFKGTSVDMNTQPVIEEFKKIKN
jgi:hypothetical protein